MMGARVVFAIALVLYVIGCVISRHPACGPDQHHVSVHGMWACVKKVP